MTGNLGLGSNDLFGLDDFDSSGNSNIWTIIDDNANALFIRSSDTNMIVFDTFTPRIGISVFMDMNDNRITELGAPQALTDAARLGDIGDTFYGLIVRESEISGYNTKSETLVFDSEFFYVQSDGMGKPLVSFHQENLPGNPLLDGNFHTDTQAASPKQGDLIVGFYTQATLWDTLPLGLDRYIPKSRGNDIQWEGVVVVGDEPANNLGTIWLDPDATASATPNIVTVTTITSDTTITTSFVVVLCDASGGNITTTLLTAVGNSGRWFVIKKIDSSANTVIIDSNGSETIDGGLTATLTSQFESINIVSDGSNWHIW